MRISLAPLCEMSSDTSGIPWTIKEWNFLECSLFIGFSGFVWKVAAYLLPFLDSYGRYMEAGVGIEPASTALQAAA